MLQLPFVMLSANAYYYCPLPIARASCHCPRLFCLAIARCRFSNLSLGVIASFVFVAAICCDRLVLLTIGVVCCVWLLSSLAALAIGFWLRMPGVIIAHAYCQVIVHCHCLLSVHVVLVLAVVITFIIVFAAAS